jgi:lysophospholipase L1-like esterase
MSCPLPVKAGPLKIACVGDSITQGNGATDQGKKGYPGQLADLLGSNFKVGNFGHSGASLTGGSYAGTPEYTGAQSFAPDVVVIMLGTNDINVFAFPKIGDFVGDYLKMIAVFRALPSHPVVFLGLPPWVKMDDVNYGYTEARLTTEILPRIRQVAQTSSACLIDIHAVTINHPEYYFDNLHPNDTGYGVLAKTVQQSLE